MTDTMPDTEKEIRLTDALLRIESELSEIKHLITGNGTPERGLIVRLDRLEQSAIAQNVRTSKLTGLLFTVAGGTLVAVCIAVLKLVSPNL